MAQADTDGINNAFDAIVHSPQDAVEFARILSEQPQAVIRRVLNLTRYQRAGLGEMTDGEIEEIIRPVIDVLQSADPLRLRGLRLTESITRESPVKIRCRVEIEW